ncbi:uncharacterized protein PGTG_05616 [Puccinia graminis f. sp. tritici CRL 75-36-700-3]|uniref:Uncharacterized protein n=1 Tax=Puccinia graminis f. sp. tritici (strain CRL 75-36-700-3 / race SCCL) TaxID=418459 RepID=E3K4Y0_PUCGT|nr:uncharacterized protein PGTG_05616 [Puccinia graminis f. sp. tritici CRL 75-36-700-3]EFP79295.2 hypothetical protein PGTG_05616 [Puccinia graminis f. sp. tritici CRL 75-36-700-3]
MSTRSNNPNLHGPLPPATRPRRSKSAGGTGEPFEIDNNSKETSADSHQGDGDIGSQRLSPDNQPCDDRSGKNRSPSDNSRDQCPRLHGLGSVGAKNASPENGSSDHSFGSDGRGSRSFNLFGGYPATPQVAGEAGDSQKVLQKLIPREELEEFVKGWNPWTIKKELFPTAPKNNDGKKRSSSSKGAKERYNDPKRWKMVMRGCNTLEAAYRHMAD